MTGGMSPAQKRLTLALWALVALALVAVLWVRVIGPRLAPTVADTLGRGDYALTASDGSAFSRRTLDGAPSAVFFGFTHCPDVCPTTLGDVTTWQDALAESGQELRVFFVTVDPERDTLPVLRDYVSWAPGVTGVTGSPEEIAGAVRAFRIYARKVPLEDGGYTMDHSASVLLFDEHGRFFESIGYQEGDARALEKIRRMIDG